MNLKHKTISGIKWTTSSTVITTTVQFLQTAILARFLAPSDYGLMAVVTVVIGFASTFIDMGLTNAIIYRPTISSTQLSTLYWLNIASGFVLFLITSLLSPFIASFYNQSMLIELIILIGFSFFISAFGTQFSAILQKELKFDLLAKVNITSNFVSLLTAVTLAVLGYGIYSLIAANLVSAILNTSILMYIGFRIHPPKLEFNFPAVKEFLSFGYFQMGEQTINYFNSQFDMILIGRFFGVETLGLYTIAKNLAMRPYQIITPIITKVTMPVMAKTNHDDYLLKDIYLKTINYTSSLNFPVYVALFVLAEPIVMLIYGSRWSEAIIMVQLLSAYTLIRSTGSSAGSLLMAKGKAALAFYWNLALFTIIPVTIYIGSFWGVYGVVYALILQQLILFTPSYKILIARLLPITFGEYFQPIAIPVLLSTLTGLVCYFLLLLSQNYFVQLLSILITGGIIYISLSIFFNNKFITAVKSLI